MKAIRSTVLVMVWFVFMLGGCALKQDAREKTEPVRLAQINCIGILPAAWMGEAESVPLYIPEEKGSRHAIEVMNQILSQELGGKDKVRFVGIDQIAALDMTGGESALDIARMAGERANCNAMLESTVKRFDERVGGRYSVETPASVAFEMRLFALESGAVVWSAKFDETQKSVMENILELGKANTRGFVWLTAEELMREGVRGKLAGSPYFSPAQ